MTTAQFFEKFDLFAGAPDAVAKMRSLILELAVRGQLTSATSHPSAPSDPSANPFPIPQDWRWVTLGEIVSFSIGKTPPRGQPQYWDSDDHPWVSIADMRHYETVQRTKESVSTRAAKEIFGGRFAEKGSILMSFKLTIGKVARAGIRCFHNEAIISLLPPDKTLAEYLFRFLPVFASLQTSNNAIKGRTLNKALLQAIPVPLPPLAEQKRIVAKVNELMALCDQLEAQQQERETKHTALAQATLARFAEAPTPSNLNLLFHSSFSIQPSDLRKTILTLAVQGKLVPQDPNDEPATRRSSADSPFEIPSSWGWMPLGSLGLCRTGRTPPTNDPMNYGAGFPFVGPGQITTSGTFLSPEKTITHKGLSNSTESEPDDILMVCIGGSIGKTAICREALGFNQQINSIRPSTSLTDYLYLALTSGYFQQEVLARATGSATPIINKGKWEQILVPVPPLAEQKRIVAKVEELMALVDALEAQQAAADQAATHLLDAVVSELAAAA